MHYHAYSFHGQGDQILSFDSARRPGGQGFDTATVPPEKTSAWLQRPSRLVKGTWDEPGAAVEWLRQRYAEVAGSIMHSELNTEAPNVDVRAANALEQLAGGNDVVWAWWLSGGAYLNATVVCCPNRDGDQRCPIGRDGTRPAGVSGSMS